MAEYGNAVLVAARIARVEDGVVTQLFELGGDGRADFTGAEDGDVHGLGLSRGGQCARKDGILTCLLVSPRRCCHMKREYEDGCDPPA